MKKIIKILTVILTICMITTVFSACGKKGNDPIDNTTDTTPAPTADNTESAVKKDNELIDDTIQKFFGALWSRHFDEVRNYVVKDGELYQFFIENEEEYKKYLENGGDSNAELGMEIYNMDSVEITDYEIESANATVRCILQKDDGYNFEVKTKLEKHDGVWYLSEVGE